ncbi:DUF2911 domain-containing protein [uncultured Maribacter sp.]|uniref:DUF2911 domain-containing protein n=1 Tax=uncultured Maribacter sp. TaxID=431308 RepID=UPI0030EEF200|tara:strand:+ start:1485 stop:2309 length:825 start_codon:yes stop_codon:yes gene_type:complete
MSHPKASPFATIEQEVGLSKIIVEYSRPSARGRTLFGNQTNGELGLVPYGRIWRVGANKSTKITFDTDVQIEGQDLQKGTYALYAFPEEKEWQIVFHKNTTHWGDGRLNYNPQEDALRLHVIPIETLEFQESFLISFDDINHNGITMIWRWGNTKVSIPILIDTQLLMQEQITEKLSNSPSAQTYYEIARYFQEQKIKGVESLGYVNKALQIGGDTYYFHRVRSLILADLGEYSKAIAAARISLELADKEGKDEFVRLNSNSIRDWKILELKNK